jgi:S1-C subfamily serine protease
MKHASRFVRGLALLSALIGAAAFAAPKPEEPVAGTVPDIGVLVVKVEPQSPAATAGIARGDIILAVDGADVATVEDVQKAITAKKPADKVKVTVRHGDAKRTLTAELGELNGRAYLGVYFESPPLAEVQPPIRPNAGPGTTPPPDAQIRPGTRPGPRILAVTGAQIARMTAGSPAEKAGLLLGEVITAVDGRDLERGDGLAAIIGARKPGDTVTLKVLGTDSNAREVTVTLGENPQDKTKAWLGVEYRMAFRIEGSTPWAGRPPVLLGVRVTGVTEGGPAAKAGIERGDLLTSIEGTAVRTAKEVADALGSRKPGDTVKVGVARTGDGSETGIAVTLAGDPKDSAKAWLGVQLGRPWLVPGWPGGSGRGGRVPRGPGGSVPGAGAPGGTDA